MKNIRLILVLVTVLALGMNSCSKKGDTGPIGSTGPVGPAGPDNVTYSDWIALSMVYNTNDSLYEDTINAVSITQGILDSGVILTYVNFPESNGTYHVVAVSSLNTDRVYEDYSLGKINIISYSINLTSLKYRYVTIPGAKKTNSTTKLIKGYSAAELKAMPYEQVQKILSEPGN